MTCFLFCKDNGFSSPNLGYFIFCFLKQIKKSFTFVLSIIKYIEIAAFLEYLRNLFYSLRGEVLKLFKFKSNEK